MSDAALLQQVKANILGVLDEAFEHHHGIFIDKGCTLFETLDWFDAAKASKRAGAGCATVAAHVAHVTFYLELLERLMSGEKSGRVDWQEIWQTVGQVTPAGWDELKATLRSTHGRIMAMLKTEEAWAHEWTWRGALGIIAHTAYHLGAIRQARCAMK